MATLDEWLAQAGFRQGNPFALKEADRASSDIPGLFDDHADYSIIQGFFIEHPGYNQIIDGPEGTVCASSVLHAARGAGKSTSRQMLQSYCATYRPRSLIVHLTDWMPIAANQDDSRFSFAGPHLDEIILQTVAAIAAGLHKPWINEPDKPATLDVLRWMCAFSAPSLSPELCESLRERGWLHDTAPAADLRRMPARAQLKQLVEVAVAIGYKDIYILADNIDELALTTQDPAVGARLLAPLLSNLQLNEVRNLAIKYFVPSEIFRILEEHYGVRSDRIICVELRWSDKGEQGLLRMLLSKRLDFFSDGLIQSLAAIATPELRSIDDMLIIKAHGNPRLLLNLGDWTIRACAQRSSVDDWIIKAADVATALDHAERWIKTTGPIDLGIGTETPPAPEPKAMTSPEPAPQPPGLTHSSEGVPLLRIHGGVIWRGDTMLEGWQDIPGLQRALIEYLYERRGLVCRKEDLLRDLWADKEPRGDDTLRKLGERVIEVLEPDPKRPIYIEKVRGGHFRMNNAGE